MADEPTTGVVRLYRAIEAWESNGPTSLTVALLAEALYDARARFTVVETLARSARPGLSLAPDVGAVECLNDACNCSGDYQATAWTLDPTAVLAALNGDYPPGSPAGGER